MGRIKQQQSATVALISDNKLLLLKRGSTAPWNPDKYCLPGGKIDDNESLIDCALRELNEETGIVLESNQLTPLTIKYPKYSKTIFVCNEDVIYSVKLNWEHSSFLWVKYCDYGNIPTVPGLENVFKTLCHWGFLI